MKDIRNFIDMGYVIQLKDGSFIVYDGSYANQTRNMIRYITNARKGEGKPVIRAWALTHSHNDHYKNFENFVNSERWRDMTSRAPACIVTFDLSLTGVCTWIIVTAENNVV